MDSNSDGAIYWLQDPDEQRINGYPSQDDLHLSYRAPMGVLSNLVDFCFTLQYGDESARKTVTALHKDLTKKLGHEPFDKNLLAKYNFFIQQHLIGSHLALTETCQFIKSLKRLQDREIDSNAIVKSTLAAEARSRQYPWGECHNLALLAEGSPYAELLSESVSIDDEAALEQSTDDSIAREATSTHVKKKKKKKRAQTVVRGSSSKNGNVAAAKKTKDNSLKSGSDSISSDDGMPLIALKKRVAASARKGNAMRSSDKKTNTRRSMQLLDTDDSDLEDTADEDEEWSEGPSKKKSKTQKSKKTSKRRLSNGSATAAAASKRPKRFPKNRQKTNGLYTSQNHEKTVPKALSPAIDDYSSKRMRNALVRMAPILVSSCFSFEPRSHAASLFSLCSFSCECT